MVWLSLVVPNGLLVALTRSNIAQDWLQCRRGAAALCHGASVNVACQAVATQACIDRPANALTKMAKSVATTRNHSLLDQLLINLQLVEEIELAKRADILKEGEKQNSGSLLRAWPNLLQVLLTRPSLLEALDSVQRVAQKMKGLAGKMEPGCDDVNWQSLLHTTLAWYQHLPWPPVVSPRANFATEAEWEAAEWGSQAPSSSCTSEDTYLGRTFMIRHGHIDSHHSCVVGLLTAQITHLLPHLARDRHGILERHLDDMEAVLLKTPATSLIIGPWPIWAQFRYMVAWRGEVPNWGAIALPPDSLFLAHSKTRFPIAVCNQTLLTFAGAEDRAVLPQILHQWSKILSRTHCPPRIVVLVRDSAAKACAIMHAKIVDLVCLKLRNSIDLARCLYTIVALRDGAQAVLWINLRTPIDVDPFPPLLNYAIASGATVLVRHKLNSFDINMDSVFAVQGSESVLLSMLGFLASSPLRRIEDVLTALSTRNELNSELQGLSVATDCWSWIAESGCWQTVSENENDRFRRPASLSKLQLESSSQTAQRHETLNRSHAPMLRLVTSSIVLAVSYAHGCCKKSQQVNKQSALEAGADIAHALDYQSLIHGTDFERRHRAFLEASHSRRHWPVGWWIWKPLAIQWALTRVQSGDFVVWLDAGAYFQSNIMLKEAIARLLSKTDVAATRLNCCLERHWTARCVLRRLGVEGCSSIVDTEQVATGLIILRKTNASSDFVDAWLEAAEKTELLTGSCNRDHISSNRSVSYPSTSAYFQRMRRQLEYPGFCHHRADQSLFSILFKKYGFKPFPQHEANALVSFARDLM